MTVADRIRDRRLELNMTQKELSDKIGTKDRSSISKIEARGDDISMKDIVRIAEALNVTPQYLLGWEDAATIEPAQPNTDSKAYIKEYIAQLTEKFSNYSPEEIERAIRVFEIYEKSTPEVRASIELLLGSTPRKP